MILLPDAPASSGSVLPVVIGLFMGTLATAMFVITSATVRQSVAPDKLMAPILSLYYALAMASIAVGALVGGFLGTNVGPGEAITAAAAILIFASVRSAVWRIGTIETIETTYLGRLALFRSSPVSTRPQVSTRIRPSGRVTVANKVLMARVRSAVAEGVTVRVACMDTFCSDVDTRPCAYVDSAGNECTTFWCVLHAARLGDAVMCRRHRNLLIDLGLRLDQPDQLPAINDGAPGLVGWMQRALDESVHNLLSKRFSMVPGMTVLAHRPSYRLASGGPCWTATWTVEGDQLATLSVMLSVPEDNDKLVIVEVNGQEAGRGVPPWITRRQAIANVDQSTLDNERARFHEALLSSVDKVILRQRRYVGGN